MCESTTLHTPSLEPHLAPPYTLQPKMISQADGKGGKEIPIPGVKTIPSYERDYLPSWKDQNTYIRDRGWFLMTVGVAL